MSDVYLILRELHKQVFLSYKIYPLSSRFTRCFVILTKFQGSLTTHRIKCQE